MTKPCLKLVTPATVNRTVTPRRLPNRDQAKARRVGIYRRQVNWVLDADIQGFFDEECVRDTGVRLVAKRATPGPSAFLRRSKLRPSGHWVTSRGTN
jgi:hypothetical protein